MSRPSGSSAPSHTRSLKARASTPLRVLLAAILAGCGASSGIVAVGPDTYIASEMRSQALGGGDRAHDILLAEVTGFCRQQGRSVELLDLQPGGDPRGTYWPTAFGATFRCATGPDR